jgi:DNA topoisomerase-1
LTKCGLQILQKQTLIITEKPSAAKRIAIALDNEGNPKEKSEKGITYYIAKRDVAIIIAPALGHLYTITIQKSGKHQYPVFDYRWAPRHLVERRSSRIRAYIDLFSKLSRTTEKFVDACDYDIEGSTIGYTILKYACGNKEHLAYRMKYSTLTKDEIIRAYNELSSKLDFSIIEAGLARHEVDWLYGINLSRALTLISKKFSGSYTTLSTGRVQGPTLNFLEKREIQRNSFVPSPYWYIKAKVKIGNTIFEAEYEKKIIKKKIDVDNIIENCRGTKCLIEKIEKKNHQLMPPFPFYLGSLQREAYKLFKISPGGTAKIAQRLYLEALISYPRTSSQKLPATLDYRAILEKLQKNPNYEKLALVLLKKKLLKPNEGPKKDPAHPAIFPTGNLPERRLNIAEKKILDLIVKRFFAVFSYSSIVQKNTITINIDNNFFLISGTQTIEEGWLKFYQPYLKYKTNFLPSITEKRKVKFIKIISEKKFTNPPFRFNPSSLLRKMEKEKIGTKTTRSGIIHTLEKRKYVRGEKIVLTELGFEVIEILKKYCPIVVSIELTRKLEERMEDIKQGKENRDGIINDTIELLIKITETLKTKEKVIGARLSHAVQQERIQERTVGYCPSCKNGKLLILRSKRTGKRFVGCTNYFEEICKTSYPLPQKGQIKSSIKLCKKCGCPTVRVVNRGKRAWNLCLDPKCPSKRKVKKIEV